MTNGLKVTIAGLDFFGQGSNDFVINPDGFDGWDDGVSMRQENTARPGAHGSFDLPVYQDARTVSISGNVLADSPRKLQHLGRRLTGLLAGGQSGRIQVERYGDVQWANGRLAAQTRFTEHGGQNVADFQIQLWCPDPRKFGETRTFTTTTDVWVDIFHYGNFQAYPRFTVTGSIIGGYVLVVGGSTYHVAWGLEPGKPHTVDFADGRLRVNGVVVHGGVGITQTPGVLPGTVAAVTLTPVISGTANITVALTDTYI